MIDDAGHNMAHLLVGSEGTLAFFSEIELDLQPIPPHRVLGICHFPTFYQAMDATQHIVKLGPGRGRAGRPHDDRAGARHPMFRPIVDRFVRGEPDGDPADRIRRRRRRRQSAPARGSSSS